MSANEQHVTAAQDRIPFRHKVAYGCGAFANNTLAAAVGGMIIVLNLGLGMNPALVGLLGALPRLTDALTDPLMGYISDHTRTRWGRRRPYIFVGALLAGLLYLLLWSMPRGMSENFYFWWFLIGSIIFYGAYTLFATPWVALGYELTPDFHERTRLMGVQNFVGQLAYVVAPWFLWIMTDVTWLSEPPSDCSQFESAELCVKGLNQLEGAFWLALVIGVVVAVLGALPAIVLRERFVLEGAPEPDPAVVGPNPALEVVEAGHEQTASSVGQGGLVATVRDFLKGLKNTMSSKPFLLLGAATFLVFNGFILISSFQSYVIIYYVFGGDQQLGAKWVGYSGSIGAVATFAVIALVTWLATRIGKKRAFYFAIGVSVVGYVMKWWCYAPDVPWLMLVPAPFMAFGLGGLFTLMGSMIADVCDEDELKTGQRREGMFGSVFWWVVKLGMAAAIAGGGLLLNWTGFEVELAGNQSADAIFWMRICDAFIPAVASLVAIGAVWRYPITETTAMMTRKALEARRGGGQAEA